MLRKIVSLSLFLILFAAAVPNLAEAQRVVRGPRARAVAYARPVVYARPYYARPYYGRPYYYSPFYASFHWGLYGPGWYGWPGWYGAGWYGWPGAYPYGFYGQYYPYPYPYRYDTSGAARIDVKPREAQVYVDGYFVGTVDDFDGWLQRLHVGYGEHEVQIYLPGYRTRREKVLFRPGATIKISGALEPLPAGESAEKPAPAPGSRPPGERDYSAPRSRRPAEEYPRQPPRSGQEMAGSVAIRVQPGDAEVIIDGERWNAPDGDRLVVQLGEGEHRVEIRKSGYRSFSTTVRVRPGETIPLNVSLSRQEETLKVER